MKKGFALSSLAFGLAVAVVILVAEVHKTAADDDLCDPTSLKDCIPAFEGDDPISPDSVCCTQLKAQQDCYCEYLKRPILRKYLTSPKAQTIARECNVTPPACE